VLWAFGEDLLEFQDVLEVHLGDQALLVRAQCYERRRVDGVERRNSPRQVGLRLDGVGPDYRRLDGVLNDFGSDVFTAPTGNGFQPLSPPVDLPEAPLTVGLALAGIIILGGYMVLRRRHAAAVAQ